MVIIIGMLLYHGSPIRINDIGIASNTYFTDDFEVAKSYGKYVYAIKVTYGNKENFILDDHKVFCTNWRCIRMENFSISIVKKVLTLKEVTDKLTNDKDLKDLNNKLKDIYKDNEPIIVNNQGVISNIFTEEITQAIDKLQQLINFRTKQILSQYGS